MGKEKKFETDKESISTESEADIAPDGGWGWMVCFGAFMINFIVDGTMMSFGVILLELLKCYGESKARTAWVGSTLFGTSMIMGPFVGFLLERYSCRQVSIAGSLISVFGFISSMFAPNIAILILTYGVIGGIGFCMMFITSVIATSLYFTKKRALANGIAMSGGGMGIFVYGYLCNFLLSIYNWQNTLLILSGLLLNCIVFGALFRPLVEKKNIRSPNADKPSCLCPADECSTADGSTYEEYIPSGKGSLFHSATIVNPRDLHQSEFSLPIKSGYALFQRIF
ncbi:hypothetical protein KUTeg_006173 [Tegillarca granosa]|uniref:Major facilitator superfamily (MFS) profile domain-containing protein n=1 Tax=Tegillarca granosa TaxID=220873 RepID=A0ABQ9FFT9_TEGGR|nr:hypothetical protein KUTeg_006173 [Tegillarca granosa]